MVIVQVGLHKLHRMVVITKRGVSKNASMTMIAKVGPCFLLYFVVTTDWCRFIMHNLGIIVKSGATNCSEALAKPDSYGLLRELRRTPDHILGNALRQSEA